MSKTQQVVFHLPEGDTAYGQKVFRNVSNLLADETISVSVAVVANGGGIDHLLATAPTAETARKLRESGVELLLCSNTLEGSEHELDDFIDGVEVVSSAMGELTRRQANGAGYIRP